MLLALLYKSRERFQHNHTQTIINHSQILAAPALNVLRAALCWSATPVSIIAGLFLILSGPLSLFSCSLSLYVSAVVGCACSDLFLYSIQQTSLKFDLNTKTPYCSVFH